MDDQSTMTKTIEKEATVSGHKELAVIYVFILVSNKLTINE